MPPPPGRGIERLSGSDAHRLVAAQVIPHIASAIKELVENALDAGARSIDVKLANYGLDSISVSDDGAGIRASDFSAVARLHATSKLERYEQLAGSPSDAPPDGADADSDAETTHTIRRTYGRVDVDVDAREKASGDKDGVDAVHTFGFRGEALSSLCALSEKVTLLTATADVAPVGSLLVFGPDGELVGGGGGVAPHARPRGTTVTVTNLFSRLPVRQREAQRHGRRDLAHVVHCITAYALIASDVRWVCSHTPPNGCVAHPCSSSQLWGMFC